MNDQMLEHILDEIKALRAEIMTLHGEHQDLKLRVYGISILIGFASGEIKNVINAILGIK